MGETNKYKTMDTILNRILPAYICDALCKLEMSRVYEIRMRSNVSVNYGGTYYFLGENGLCGDSKQSLLATPILIEETIMRAAQHSIYAVNNQICEGFLSLAGGYRIGISGEVVIEKSIVKSVKNFSSINFRIPHQVIGCGEKAYRYLQKYGCNCLIISPPGMGKTTLLRDLSRIMGNSIPILNVLVIDERSEIASCVNGKPQLDVGVNTDVSSNCNKTYGFEKAIRAMRPDVIVTDELFSEEDFFAIENAVRSGVKVIASAHSDSRSNLYEKNGFKQAINNKLFDCYIFLSDNYGVGSIDCVCDKDYKVCI